MLFLLNDSYSKLYYYSNFSVVSTFTLWFAILYKQNGKRVTKANVKYEQMKLIVICVWKEEGFLICKKE